MTITADQSRVIASGSMNQAPPKVRLIHAMAKCDMLKLRADQEMRSAIEFALANGMEWQAIAKTMGENQSEIREWFYSS